MLIVNRAVDRVFKGNTFDYFHHRDVGVRLGGPLHSVITPRLQLKLVHVEAPDAQATRLPGLCKLAFRELYEHFSFVAGGQEPGGLACLQF